MNLQAIAKEFGGEVRGDTVLMPTPGHSNQDRGTCITAAPGAPDGCLVHCFNGGDPLAVKDLLRGRGHLPEFKPRSVIKSSPKPIRQATDFNPSNIFDYYNIDGELAYQVRRIDKPDGGKEFPVFHPDGKGGWNKGRGGPAILYRLLDIVPAPSDAIVFMAEGERKADKLAAMGFPATSSKGLPDDLASILDGSTVAVLPDNDEQGERIADKAVERLKEAGATAFKVYLTGLPDKGDILDWHGTAQELIELTEKVVRGLADGADGPRKASETKSMPQASDKNRPDQDAIALAFTAKYRDRLRCDHDIGAWFEWDGAIWRKDTTSRVMYLARETCRNHGSADRSTVIAVESFARADPAHAVTSERWDNDPMLLGTPGGVIDLRTGKKRKPLHDDYITKQTTVTPEPAKPEKFLNFLNEALAGDTETIRFLQQWCGYCLTGETREHALAFIYGPGGNGKSVFLNTITAIMGDYAATATMETFTASKYDQHSTNIAMLKGARLVSASETEQGRQWAEARVKQMTGGDPITARFMRQDNFTFTPQFKLTIAGNHAPALHTVDDAMRRRFNIVPFVVQPSKPDKHLEDKLRAEYGAILHWAIEGCLDWQRNGLTRPNAVREATADYFESQDLFGQWLTDCCEIGVEKWEHPTPLYNSWAAYARDAGEDPGAMKSFSESLQKRGYLPKRSGTKGRFYAGISLTKKKSEAHHSDGSDAW